MDDEALTLQMEIIKRIDEGLDATVVRYSDDAARYNRQRKPSTASPAQASREPASQALEITRRYRNSVIIEFAIDPTDEQRLIARVLVPDKTDRKTALLVRSQLDRNLLRYDDDDET